MYWKFAGCLTVAMALISACAEPRQDVVDPSEIWDGDVTTEEGDFPVTFASRRDGNSYNLPREGASGMSDLIEVFDELQFGESHILAEEYRDRGDTPLQQCRFEGARFTDSLPMVVEGVVTHHPRRFVKVEMCSAEEDERNWGVFTVEDDTGGVVVLRGGRTSNFSFGDRVRLTIYGGMLTFSQDADTRAITSYDLEILSAPSAIQDEAILYEPIDEAFTADDVTTVKRVEGVVQMSPSNANFNEMWISDREVAEGEPVPGTPTGALLQCVRTCPGLCERTCGDDGTCERFCSDFCVNTGERVVPADIVPVCWQANLDIDLGRRGFTVERGQHVAITGPVVNSFGRNIWIYTPAQIEYLDE